MHYEYNIDPMIIEKHPLSSIRIIKAVDNFGHAHEIHDSGGVVTADGHGYNWTIALYNLTKDVTSLTLTAEIYYISQSGEVTANMTELLEPITIPLGR